jgi:hypothetical protein
MLCCLWWTVGGASPRRTNILQGVVYCWRGGGGEEGGGVKGGKWGVVTCTARDRLWRVLALWRRLSALTFLGHADGS